MSSKFDVRRGLLLGVFGSGLAAVLSGCQSAYRGPPAWDEQETVLSEGPVHRHRPPTYRRKKLPWEDGSQGSISQSGSSMSSAGSRGGGPSGNGGNSASGGSSSSGGNSAGGGSSSSGGNSSSGGSSSSGGNSSSGGSSSSGGGGSSGNGGGWSDRRLKTEIYAIGHSPSGLPIYRFRYVWGGPAYVGVMAQDLLATRPDAVIVTESGYLMVDYDRIDVTMMPLADYDMCEHQVGHSARFDLAIG